MNWKDSFKNFHYHRYLGFLDLIYYEYPCPSLLGSRMGIPSQRSWKKWIFSSNHDGILFILQYTFPYKKMTLWYTTPRSPFTSLTIREMWLFIVKKNAPSTLVRKAKKTYYCLKYTKAKRFTLVLNPLKYIPVFGRRQNNWFGLLV